MQMYAFLILSMSAITFTLCCYHTIHEKLLCKEKHKRIKKKWSNLCHSEFFTHFEHHKILFLHFKPKRPNHVEFTHFHITNFSLNLNSSNSNSWKLPFPYSPTTIDFILRCILLLFFYQCR